LQQNLVGEMRFFKEGMSVGDLMNAYASGSPFTKVNEWDSTVGYCFHGDHAIGYFFNYYHVSVPDWILNETTPTDTIGMLYSFKKLAGSAEVGHTGNGGECSNTFNKCTTEARICRNMNGEQMMSLYALQRPSVTK
jgi:hypothetical protein